jgi:hypothetical protein
MAITSDALDGGGKLHSVSTPATNESPAEMPPVQSRSEIVALQPGLDPRFESTEDLQTLHDRVHKAHEELAQVDVVGALDVEGAVNLHAEIVAELVYRGDEHPPPPGDALDVVTKALVGDLDEQKTEVDTAPVIKSSALYDEPPTEGRRYRFVVQTHWRGKSVHMDLRIEHSRKRLLGWTLNTQQAGSVKEPVESLAEARKRQKTVGTWNKLDWASGKWPQKDKRPQQFLTERKATHPSAWLTVEGKTPKTKPGDPPAPGATANYPGVFQIIDQGTVEYGAQREDLHEYFLRGRMRGRLLLRKSEAQASTEKRRYSQTQCMADGCDTTPTIDVTWADGKARAWFCDVCYRRWRRSCKEEIKQERRIKGPRAQAKVLDVHKAAPPASYPERLDDAAWLATMPADPTPYVLSAGAVKDGWIPPMGHAALPKAVRDQIPTVHRYWMAKDAAEVRKRRDALVETLKDGTVELSAVRQRTVAKRFVLQGVEWNSKNAKAETWLRVDVGKAALLVAEFDRDPREATQGAASLGWDSRIQSLEETGPIAPAHYLNVRKSEAGSIDMLDSGLAKVLDLSDTLVTLVCDGESFRHTVVFKRTGTTTWTWQVAQNETQDADDDVSVSRFVPVVKVDKERRLVTGVVLEPGEIDAHNDIIHAEAVEQSAHNFLSRFNAETELGVMHKQFGSVGLELVESWIQRTATKMSKQRIKKGTWLMTMHVTSDDLWKKVKKGAFTGFSVGGVAKVAR